MRLCRWILVGGPPIVIAAILAFARFSLIIVTVDGESMAPALLPGDRLLLVRYRVTARIRKGAIALIEFPLRPPSSGDVATVSRVFIKRIVGVAGETVITALDDLPSSLRAYHSNAHNVDGWRTWQIPSGHYFVRGDQVGTSIDSLIWGPIPSWTIKGIAIAKLPLRTQVPIKHSTRASVTDRM